LHVTSRPEIGERVAADRRERLIGGIDGKYMLGNGVEQPVLVSEQPVDGRRLHAGRQGNGTRGDGGRALLIRPGACCAVWVTPCGP
jgi:hypothetical protein